MNCPPLIEILQTILASLVSEKTPSISTLTTMKHHTLLALILGLASAAPLNAKWQRISSSGDRPVPVGQRGMASQASLASSAGLGKADALLSQDPADAVTASAGNSNAVLGLAKPTMINRASFANDGIEGRATLSGSADNKSWAVLDEKVFTASDRDVTFVFAGMQVRFVKLEFALSKGGSIRAFQMFGGERDSDYVVKQGVSDTKKGYPVNFAGVGGSRVIYASPKPEGGLDESADYNKFSFPESDDRYRTLIYDLGQLRLLNSFGSVHSPRPVRFEVFTFDKLPEKEDWRGRLVFEPSDFNVREPIAAVEDTRGLGFVKASLNKPAAARYVAMRWEPDFNPPAFTVTIGSLSGNTYNTKADVAAALVASGAAPSQAAALTMVDSMIQDGTITDTDAGVGNANGTGNGSANGTGNGSANGSANGTGNGNANGYGTGGIVGGGGGNSPPAGNN